MNLFPTFPLLDSWYFAQTAEKHTEKQTKASKLLIVGNVYNHPGFKDGELIKSAPIQKVDLERGLVRTTDKTYSLGAPQAQWLEWLQETKQDKDINIFLEKHGLRN